MMAVTVLLAAVLAAAGWALHRKLRPDAYWWTRLRFLGNLCGVTTAALLLLSSFLGRFMNADPVLYLALWLGVVAFASWTAASGVDPTAGKRLPKWIFIGWALIIPVTGWLAGFPAAYVRGQHGAPSSWTAPLIYGGWLSVVVAIIAVLHLVLVGSVRRHNWARMMEAKRTAQLHELAEQRRQQSGRPRRRRAPKR